MEPTPAPSSATLAALHATRQNTNDNSNITHGQGQETHRNGATVASSNSGGIDNIQTQNPLDHASEPSTNNNDNNDPNITLFLRELESISTHSKQQQQQQQLPQTTSSSSSSNTVNHEPNRCYICFGTDEDSVGRWVKPCQCTLISHEDCLLDWIDKNRQQFAKKQVRCSVCNTVYRLTEPNSWLLNIYSTFDSIVHAGVPYLTFLGLTCSVLITSTTYGAYAVLTVCGTEEGEKLLGSPNPWGWRVWIGLPLIPVLLVSSRTKAIDSFMPLIPLLVVGNEQLQVTYPPTPALTLSIMPWVRMAYNSLWAEMVSRLEMRWRRQQAAGSGVARLGVNASIDQPDMNLSTAEATRNIHNTVAEEEPPFFERKDLGRTIIGALLMPAISSICGSILGNFSFFRTRFPDNFHRNILGGCFFVVLKDLAALIGRYQEMRRRRVRRVREYSEFKDE
ncbi:hypothetical protein BX616_003114 [Lobosporangium transversale]|uniref:RING-CH-type domain-containing protein n=1 Tax=Lobosporangium transversale TaxID=64571 RepID=A0A1Y2G985_9FUNG|nr:hypothetical protein BCR41DRAFT_425795 [Lobosporangium transversale]KAF9916690.1 hypothetical protein BX616_003114 [Lobosporangium transversale]ORZ04673.1 hypothetical protein BCR41DRAFT_425795 [Lobosporangium transversale]|eukprot:XP_021876670.1 hypothetical protein BCR41DRAFT_425795 [Lobosporangium transversale]